MNNIIIFLIIVPFLASFFTFLEKYFPSSHIAEISSTGATATCLVLLTLLFSSVLTPEVIRYPLGGWAEPVGISLYMDGFAWISSVIGCLIAFFALIFAGGEKKYGYKFYFFFLMLLGGMQGVILTGDLFNMFVFFEILSIASYILIAYPRKEKSLMASFNYLFISSVGIGFFLLGIALLYQQTGILSLREIANLKGQFTETSFRFTLPVIFLVVGIGVKAAFIPFHTWLPNAHAFAPHPVSAILSGAMIKVSFLAIWRILKTLPAPELNLPFLWIGAFTAFLAIIWAVAQNDSKKVLAYSSVSQIGFIVASFGMATSSSLLASLYHILSHSLFKSLLFLTIGAIIYATGKRKIDELAGMGRKMPLLGISFLIGALAISGIAPLNGYVSKTLICHSLQEHPAVYYLIFGASVGTVASFLKLSRIFRGNPYRKDIQMRRVSIRMTAPLIVLSILCFLTGLLPSTGNILSRLLFQQNLYSQFSVYSLSALAQSGIIFAVGSAVYILIASSGGKRVLRHIRNLECGLNESLLLFLGGVLLFVVICWFGG